MHEILETLRQEHRDTVSLINALERQVARFERGGAPDYDVISATLEYFLSFPDLHHHPKENLVFAKLRERDASAAASVGDLHREHEELAARSREFSVALRAVLDEAEIPRKTFVDRARRFIDLQRRHLEMEELNFFPAADKTLTEEDWVDLRGRVAAGKDSLSGKNAAAKLDSLRQTILAWQAQEKAGKE